jgi:hypothetical protein
MADAGLLKRTCSGDEEALKLLNLIDEAEKEAPAVFHGNRYTSSAVDNIHSTIRPAGTTRQRALRMLRTGRPDLHAQVLAKLKCPDVGTTSAQALGGRDVFPEFPENFQRLEAMRARA